MKPDKKTKPPALYRRLFTPLERRQLDSLSPGSARSELSLLRILLTRVLDTSRQETPLSLATRTAMLAAFSGSALIMASLVRFENTYAEAYAANDLLAILAEMDPDDL